MYLVSEESVMSKQNPLCSSTLKFFPFDRHLRFEMKNASLIILLLVYDDIFSQITLGVEDIHVSLIVGNRSMCCQWNFPFVQTLPLAVQAKEETGVVTCTSNLFLKRVASIPIQSHRLYRTQYVGSPF